MRGLEVALLMMQADMGSKWRQQWCYRCEPLVRCSSRVHSATIFSFTAAKPSPPVNISHSQTIEAELILRWDDPPDVDAGTLRYEVRYSSNKNRLAWQVNAKPFMILMLWCSKWIVAY